MVQLTLRKVPEEVARALRMRAARHGRSAESEHRILLTEALQGETHDFWALADLSRERLRRQRSDSAQLQREMRDER